VERYTAECEAARTALNLEKSRASSKTFEIFPVYGLCGIVSPVPVVTSIRWLV